MKSPNQSLWPKLTDAQRAQSVAILVQMLLRQLVQRREVESA